MGKRDIFTRILAVAGTVFVWFPILAPVILTLIVLVLDGIFRFDYLMPGELFTVAFLGGGALVWSAFRAKLHKKFLGWGLVAMVGLLVISQLPFVILQPIVGDAEPPRQVMPFLYLGMGLFGLYVAAVISEGVGAVLLLRDVFKPTPPLEQESPR